MYNVITYIYALIILESRMSIDIASKVFNVDKNILREQLMHENFSCEKIRAIEFCEYENQVGLIDVKKSIFMGKLLYARFKKILNGDNKKERLLCFIKELDGKDKIEPLFEKHLLSWTLEDKEKFFKYKIKFALDNYTLPKIFPITRQTISRWVSKYPEGKIKEELLALNGYVCMIYNEQRMGERYAK